MLKFHSCFYPFKGKLLQHLEKPSSGRFPPEDISLHNTVNPLPHDAEF